MLAGHVTTALPLELHKRGSRVVVSGMCVHTTPPCRTPDQRLTTTDIKNQRTARGEVVLLGRKTETIYTVFFDTYKPFSGIYRGVPGMAHYIRIQYNPFN